MRALWRESTPPPDAVRTVSRGPATGTVATGDHGVSDWIVGVRLRPSQSARGSTRAPGIYAVKVACYAKFRVLARVDEGGFAGTSPLSVAMN